MNGQRNAVLVCKFTKATYDNLESDSRWRGGRKTASTQRPPQMPPPMPKVKTLTATTKADVVRVSKRLGDPRLRHEIGAGSDRAGDRSRAASTRKKDYEVQC